MSEQLEAAFEDILHRLARKFNKRGLSVKAIGDSFADRAWFARYIPEHAEEWPIVFSSETARRRAAG